MKLPKNAKKVFEGIIFDVYHWEQKMFDGSMATYEGLKRPDSVGVIGVTEEGKIMIGRQEQPQTGEFLGFYGGMIDQGETPLEAAKREFLEETGCVSDDWEQIWEHDLSMTKIEWTVYTFVARNCKKIQETNHENGEKITLELIDFDELLAVVSRPDFRDKETALELLRMSDEELKKFREKLYRN